MDAKPLLSVCIFDVGGEIAYTVHDMETEDPTDISDQYDLANVQTTDARAGFALFKKEAENGGDGETGG